MPLKQLIWILATAIGAGLITVWIATRVAGSLDAGGNILFSLVPILLIGVVLTRLIVERRK